MKVGVADYGMNVWYSGLYDVQQRLEDLKGIGYEGTERLIACSPGDAIDKACIYKRLGMDFALCLGPDPQSTIRWTSALGKDYIWATVATQDWDVLSRQINHQAEICKRWGIRVAVHNHLGTPIETHEQVEKYLDVCPDCGLVFDMGHLAGAGGDCMKIARDYADRVFSIHAKDWLADKKNADDESWGKRGRFCELGAGNIDLDIAGVLQSLQKQGYDGWILVEHDTHLQDPLKDLAISREYLREAGF